MAEEMAGQQAKDALPEFMNPEAQNADPAVSNYTEIQSILKDTSREDDLEDDVLLTGEGFDEVDEELAPPKSYFGMILLALCVIAIVVGIFYIRSNEKWMADLDCFFNGDIAKCKMHDVEIQKARWREEDRSTRPKYGDLVLTYFPQDAKVTIEQVVVRQKGFKGEKLAPETTVIPNKSTELKENEVIEQLPLMNLPIRERDRDDAGEITEVRVFAYHIKIEREGYEPREFNFEQDDWQKLGPEVNYSIPWNGCDLVPKPETIQEPFRKAMRELYCLEKYYEKDGKKAGMTEGDYRGRRKEIQIRHGFKTTAEFEKFSAMLMANEEWWKPAWEEIQKEKCPEPDAQ